MGGCLGHLRAIRWFLCGPAHIRLHCHIGNGFVTPVPTLVLYAAFTVDFLPALAAGIIGAMLFWQLTYGTALYWVSFFLAKRQARLSRQDIRIYIWMLNSPWLLFALLGLYVSIRLIADGDYGVLGY